MKNLKPSQLPEGTVMDCLIAQSGFCYVCNGTKEETDE